MAEYRPSATASGQYSVTCSNPCFGDKYNAYELNVIYLILIYNSFKVRHYVYIFFNKISLILNILR